MESLRNPTHQHEQVGSENRLTSANHAEWPGPAGGVTSRDIVSAPSTRRSIVLLGVGSGILYALVYVLSRSFAPLHRADPSNLSALIVLYIVATLALFLLYVRVVEYAATGRMTGAHVRRLAIAFPIAFNIALCAARP